MKQTFCLLAIIFLLSCGKSGVQFQDSFQKTLSKAKETGQPILIDFYSPT